MAEDNGRKELEGFLQANTPDPRFSIRANTADTLAALRERYGESEVASWGSPQEQLMKASSFQGTDPDSHTAALLRRKHAPQTNVELQTRLAEIEHSAWARERGRDSGALGVAEVAITAPAYYAARKSGLLAGRSDPRLSAVGNSLKAAVEGMQQRERQEQRDRANAAAKAMRTDG